MAESERQLSMVLDLLVTYKWKEMFGGFGRDPATIE